MKRSTKRIVGWGSGVAISVVLILLAVIIASLMGGAPTKLHPVSDKMVSVEGESVIVIEEANAD